MMTAHESHASAMKSQEPCNRGAASGFLRSGVLRTPAPPIQNHPMPVEIERKFLVVSDGWRSGAIGQRFCQGYLARADGVTVRVRRAGARAYLTVKGEPNGIVRPEFEYEGAGRARPRQCSSCARVR